MRNPSNKSKYEDEIWTITDAKASDQGLLAERKKALDNVKHLINDTSMYDELFNKKVTQLGWSNLDTKVLTYGEYATNKILEKIENHLYTDW